MEIPRKIYRAPLGMCNLCHHAKCTAACPHGLDPAKIIRHVWFDNECGAAADLRGTDACRTCPAPCSRACDQSMDIRRLLLRLKDGGYPEIEPERDRLKTNICGIPVENPFLLSSSVVSSTYEMCARAFEAGWAGAAFKTISCMDMHEASPRYAAIRGEAGGIVGFKNIEQLSDHTVAENMDILRRLKRDYPTKFLLASIMGRDEAEWRDLAKACADAGADALELNFSCPNMTRKGTGSDVGQCADLVEVFTRAVREAVRVPVLAKLTPNVESMLSAADAAVRGGADGLAAINTVKSLITIRHTTGQVAVGGYSGRAVRPIALRFIAELGGDPRLKGVHLSGMGGVETWRDALDFIALGCGSVQVTTAVMEYGVGIIDDLTDGLARFLTANDKTVKGTIGMSARTVTDIEKIERDKVILPRFLREKCFGCGRCFVSCRDGGHQAITFGADRKPVLDPKRCVGCHLCTLVCPENAIVSSGVVRK